MECLCTVYSLPSQMNEWFCDTKGHVLMRYHCVHVIYASITMSTDVDLIGHLVVRRKKITQTVFILLIFSCLFIKHSCKISKNVFCNADVIKNEWVLSNPCKKKLTSSHQEQGARKRHKTATFAATNQGREWNQQIIGIWVVGRSEVVSLFQHGTFIFVQPYSEVTFSMKVCWNYSKIRFEMQ